MSVHDEDTLARCERLILARSRRRGAEICFARCPSSHGTGEHCSSSVTPTGALVTSMRRWRRTRTSSAEPTDAAMAWRIGQLHLQQYEPRRALEAYNAPTCPAASRSTERGSRRASPPRTGSSAPKPP